MAVYTSLTTGLFSAGTTWVGGVKPPSALGNSIIIALGHVVTYDEAGGEYGDDTSTGIGVNGTLKVSRTVSTSLTAKGDLRIGTATTATIDWGRRSTSDPIPTGITATLILNYSATMANFKWGLYVGEGANAYFCGATKTINTYIITSNLAVSATSAIVNDITGWAIGDNIILAASDGTYSHWETKVLTSVTPGAGSTGTVGWAVGLSYTHAINCPVGNRTSNVTVKNYNTTTVAYACFFHSSTASNNRREVDYTSFEYVGSNTGNPTTQCFIASNTNTVTTPFLTFSNNFFFQCNQSSTLFIYLWNSNGFDMTNLGFFSTNGSYASNTYTAAGTFVKISNSVYYYNNGVNHVSAYSQGGQGCILSGNTYCSSASAFINNGNGDGLSVVNCKFHSASGTALVQLSAGSVNFSSCNFGDSTLWGTPEFSYIVNAGSAPGQVFKGTISDSKFGTPATSFYQNLSLTNPSYLLTVINKNLSVISQEEYSYAGVVIRDNTTFNRSPSSDKLNPQTANRTFTRTYKVPAPNNTARRVIGYLNYDTNYGAGTPPSVTLSGLGISPVTYTATTINTWNKFDLSATQTSGNDGNLTLTVSGQSTTTTGFFWVDGIPDDPFITNCRHYGFLFDGLIYRKVDPIIQTATEATVGAYTGIAIAGSTITLTVNHSVRELYDYCKWYLCQTANLSTAEFFTSTDGVNFSTTYNLVMINANLTGTANITTTGTLTVTGTSTSTPIITASNGKTGYLNISGLSGHAVYLQDGSGVQKDYQASVTGTYNYFLSNILTGTWTYTIAKYGFNPLSSTFVASTGGNTDDAIVLTADTGITQATVATVIAYTTIDSFDRLYDYSAYFQTTNAGIKLARLVNKNGTGLTLGSSNLAINATAGSAFSYTSPTITIKAPNLTAGVTYPGSLITTGVVSFLNGATTNSLYTDSIGSSAILSISGLSAHAIYVENNTALQKDYQVSVTGTYSLWIPNTAIGTWKYVIKKAGSIYQVGTFTPATGGQFNIATSTPQKLKPDGSPMYTGTTTALVTISFTGTAQANIQIGNGEVTAQQAFDMTATALTTNAGMIWLSLRGECSIFLSFGGNYLFMTNLWRIQRRTAGDANATLDAFVISSDGVPVDNVNGGVLFLTSSVASDIATAVRNILKGVVIINLNDNSINDDISIIT